MKRFKNYIAKHYEGIALLAVLSMIVVGDAELHTIIAWLPVPITILLVSYIGKRINDKQNKKGKESD